MANSSAKKVLAALREFAHAALGQRRFFRVRGESMEPTLSDGDFVWVDCSDDGDRQRPRADDIVVACEPGTDRVVVKRVRGRGTKTVSLGSDNPFEARDSRHYGSVDLANVIGIATLRWRTRGWRIERLARRR